MGGGLKRICRLPAIFVLGLLVSLSLNLWAEGPGEGSAAAAPALGGHLVVAVPVEPDTFDPHKAVAAATEEIDFNVYQGLVSFDQEGRIIPCLAESWQISEDGTSYTFHIRDGVLFHNGRRLTAADVVFSLERIRDDATGFP